jgi:hypothetical protein
MPAVQLNWNYYTYVSGDGTTYNIRSASEWAATAEHGLDARTPGAPRFMTTRQNSPRRFIYRDATTGRTKTGPVGTAADFAAAALGDVVAFAVEGLAGTVNYELVKKVQEKIPTSIVGTQLADHA